MGPKAENIMMPQLITVHDIHAAIDDVGVFPYQNTLVQEVGGDFYFVSFEDVGYFEHSPEPRCPEEFFYEDCDDKQLGEGNCDFLGSRHYACRIWPVPLRLAWFVIDALRLKSDAMSLGTAEGDKPCKQAVYLTPGKEFMGQKITRRTEVPAELGPVVVEKL